MTSKNLEREPLTPRLLRWAVAASFLLHGVAYTSLHAAPTPSKSEHQKTELRFDVVERERAQALPPPPPEPLKPLKSLKSLKPRAHEPKPEPKQETAPAPPQPPAPQVTEGVTLAADGGSNAFSMPLGNGGALDPTRTRAPEPVSMPAPIHLPQVPVVSEPPVVAISDLSERPSPPSLADALERNYPSDARRRGLSGVAKVRARIDPDGLVRRVSLVEESAPGFGNACSRTLNGSRWAAPKDKAGRSVATEIRYTCRFVVQP